MGLHPAIIGVELLLLGFGHGSGGSRIIASKLISHYLLNDDKGKGRMRISVVGLEGFKKTRGLVAEAHAWNSADIHANENQKVAKVDMSETIEDKDGSLKKNDEA